MGRKIAIIGTVGIPAKYGGFETLTEYLTRYLSKQYDFTVYCSRKSYKTRVNEYNGARLVYLPLNANGVQSIFYDIVSIFHALKSTDILLILGVSGCFVLPFVKLISNKKIVVNIDGLEWKRDKWGKIARWFLKYSEKLAVSIADTIVADNKIIQEYILNEYGKSSQLIEYGADHVKKTKLSEAVLANYPYLAKRYALSVCRIEPENNLHIILEAMAKQGCLPLIIVGNWDASDYGANLRRQYSEINNIYLLDPIYDQNVLDQIRSNCYIYLHGHSAGGTNPSLVEAMYLGLPIIAFSVEYNKITTENEAIFFSSSKELNDIINNINSYELDKSGKKMQDIAVQRYTWQKIANQYSVLFSILGNSQI